jgi:ADP-heptose:LPS heptosyltransferase
MKLMFPDNTINKILVFRALQLGDLLCTVPALRALRLAYPNAEITLLSLPWAESFVARFNRYLDRFIHFIGFPGLPEQPFDATGFPEFLHKIQDERFDLILQMQGNGSIVNPMIALLNGRHSAGFRLANDYAPDEQSFLQYPTGIHEIERHLALMQHIGADHSDTDLEFPLTEKDFSDLANADITVTNKRYACVHPGSRGAWRQWPTAHFAMIGDYFAGHGFEIVLTGTKDEMNIIEDVRRQMKHPSIIAAGRTSLGAIAALISNAFLLVSNCTGVSHIAAATKTKSIVISMDGEPERWAPMNTNLHFTIDWLRDPDIDKVMEQARNLANGASATYSPHQ